MVPKALNQPDHTEPTLGSLHLCAFSIYLSYDQEVHWPHTDSPREEVCCIVRFEVQNSPWASPFSGIWWALYRLPPTASLYQTVAIHLLPPTTMRPGDSER